MLVINKHSPRRNLFGFKQSLNIPRADPRETSRFSVTPICRFNVPCRILKLLFLIFYCTADLLYQLSKWLPDSHLDVKFPQSIP